MHCTILGMVKPTLFGGIGGKLREKMSNGYRNCNYHLFSFYFVKYLLNKTKNFIKNTPINRGNTPKYVFYIFFLFHPDPHILPIGRSQTDPESFCWEPLLRVPHSVWN